MVSATTKIVSSRKDGKQKDKKENKRKLSSFECSFQSEEKVRIDKILVITILFEQWRRSCNAIKPVFSDLLELEGS